MKFEKDELLEKQTDDIMDAIKNYNRGHELPHMFFANKAHVEYGTDEYHTLIDSVRKALLNTRGIALVNIREWGYRLATVNEQHQVLPIDAMLEAARCLYRGIKVVHSIPKSELSPEQAVVARSQINAMQDGRNELAKKIKKQRAVVSESREQEKKKKTRAQRNAEKLEAKIARDKRNRKRITKTTPKYVTI